MNEAIEKLYTVFSKYTSANMQHCDCGCIDPVEVKKLMSKPLRELTEDDFAYYHGSAMNTWGEVEHYKHFLPRILEVHHQKKGKGIIGLYEINTKLTSAEWETWDPKEIKAIKEFLLTDWSYFIAEEDAQIGIDNFENYTFFFPLHDLLALWKIQDNKNQLSNFVHFFYAYGNEILNKGLKIHHKVYQTEFVEFIQQHNLTVALEKEYFIQAEMDTTYAEKVSAVLQMIEQ